MTDPLFDLRQKRLAELQTMGAARIRAEIRKAVESDWKTERIIQVKIAQHQHEWGRDDLSVDEFRAIGRRIKQDPASRIFTYIHDSFPHYRGYCFVSTAGEVLHCQVDAGLNKTCFKPKNLARYLQSRRHWIELDREGRIL